MRFFCLFFISISSIFGYSQSNKTDTLRIYYPIDITSLNDASRKSLDSLGAMVKRNKKARLSILGFADYLGTNPHNVDLSVGRAFTVKEYLIGLGIDTLQIKTCEGKGALQPGDVKNKQKGIPRHRKVELVVTWPVLTKPPLKKSSLKNNIEKSTAPPIEIKNLKKGDKFILKNLNFEGGRHMLIQESFPILQDLTRIMKTNPGLNIEIQGHI